MANRIDWAALLPSDRPATLNPRQWRVLTARYRDGRSLDDIGNELGVTRERLQNILLRGKLRLKQHLIGQAERQADRTLWHTWGGTDGLA